jgi:hypothetical protein
MVVKSSSFMMVFIPPIMNGSPSGFRLISC